MRDTIHEVTYFQPRPHEVFHDFIVTNNVVIIAMSWIISSLEDVTELSVHTDE